MKVISVNDVGSTASPKLVGEVTIKREGDQIVLPPDMSIGEAKEWLTRREKEDETEVAISTVIDCFPLDGAHALQLALSQIYGWTNMIPTPGFFGPNPPAQVSAQCGPNGRTVQVAWGRIQTPGIEGYFETSCALKEGRFIFAINGAVKRKHEKKAKEICDRTAELVKTKSLYRGQAIALNFTNVHPDNYDLRADQPRFLDPSDAKESELTFNDDVRRQIQDSLFTLIDKADRCREHKIPLKRGVLLEGPYGTGKTMTAFVAARKALAAGWTFVYLTDSRHLKKAVAFAQQYAPAVLFAEDIDRAMTGARDADMDGILNTIDGIDSKTSEVLVVLTSNHVENINAAMLRPGRLDAVIHVAAPDAKTAARLIQTYARGLLAADADLAPIGEKLAGQIPAVIREVVERAKLAAITHLADGEELAISTEDLHAASDSIAMHLDVMNRARVKSERAEVDQRHAKQVKNFAEALVEAAQG